MLSATVAIKLRLWIPNGVYLYVRHAFACDKLYAWGLQEAHVTGTSIGDECDGTVLFTDEEQPSLRPTTK